MRILDFADGFESVTSPTIEGVPASQITFTPVGGVSATDVQAAIAEVDSEKVAKVTSTDNAVTRFDGTTGAVQNSGVTIDDSDNMIIPGNLTVQGTQTTLNTQTLDVADQNITVSKGGNDIAAEGAGLTVDRTSTKGSLVFDSTKASKWKAGLLASEVELVDISSSQTLSNKTLDNPISNVLNLTEQSATPSTPASGIKKVYAKNDGKVYTLDSAGTEAQVGSGASGGALNFIGNPDAETNTSGWATYADAAGVLPVDGTGGSPSSTWTRSTSSPLTGTGSFLWTKSANNRQGEGVSYDFTIDSASRARVMNIEFDYAIASGTFVPGSNGVDSDLEVYIYDVTNGVLIQPSSYKLLSNSSTIADHFRATFQTASNSTSYRLILHTATTSASAYTIKFDSVSVARSKYTYGTPITDWVSYAPTFTGFGTVTGISFQSRRIGDSLEFQGSFTTGTPTAVANGISLGFNGGNANVTIDSSKIAANTQCGIVGLDNFAATLFDWGLLPYQLTTSSVSITTQTSTVSKQAGGSLGSSLVAGSKVVSISGKVPIVGWSSNVQMSNDTDTRVIAAEMATLTSTSYTAGNNLAFTSTIFDNSGSLNTGAGTFTVPVSGYYNCTLSGVLGNVATDWNIYVNGISRIFIVTSPATGSTRASGSIPVLVNAGDVISLRSNTSITFVSTAAIQASFFRLSGPSVIAATESVNARYTSSSTALSSTPAVIVNPTKTYDSHNAYNTSTGLYTVPVSGKYSVKAMSNFSSYTLTGQIQLYLYKNGSLYSTMVNVTGSGASGWAMNGSDDVSCNAGDTLAIYGYAGSGAAGTLSGSSTNNYIAIARVGN